MQVERLLSTYWGLQNNWESSNGFERFFSSKLVQKSVENRCSIPNYFANRSKAIKVDTHITAKYTRLKWQEHNAIGRALPRNADP